MDEKTLDFYNKNSHSLFSNYRNASPQYLNDILRVFNPGSKVLDIGTGSGRDLKIMTELGFDAYGLEPSQNFINQIKSTYSNIEHIELGSLPDAIPDNYNNFDGILVSSVLQHITNSKLSDSIYKIHSMLNEDGVLLISVPTKYPNIKLDRDGDNRLFIIRQKDEYLLLLKRIGFILIEESISSDALGREGVEWTTLVLKKDNQIEFSK